MCFFLLKDSNLDFRVQIWIGSKIWCKFSDTEIKKSLFWYLVQVFFLAKLNWFIRRIPIWILRLISGSDQKFVKIPNFLGKINLNPQKEKSWIWGRNRNRIKNLPFKSHYFDVFFICFYNYKIPKLVAHSSPPFGARRISSPWNRLNLVLENDRLSQLDPTSH